MTSAPPLRPQVEENYLSQIGLPTKTLLYHFGSHTKLRILEYCDLLEGFRAYCSLGFFVDAPRSRCVQEALVVTDMGFYDEIPRSLAQALFSCLERNLPLYRGLVVDGLHLADRSFLRMTSKGSFYFTAIRGISKLSTHFSIDSLNGELFMAVPISPEELLYRRRFGFERFEVLLDGLGAGAFRMLRASLVDPSLEVRRGSR